MLAWLASLFSTWLGGPLGWLVGLFVNAGINKAETDIGAAIAQQKSDADIDLERNAAAKAEQDAQTKAELDRADDSLINGL